MEEFKTFLFTYGLPLTAIAVAGVVILGVLKYANVFKNLKEETRHILYLLISVGLTVIGILIYLLATGHFEWLYFIGLIAAVWTLNQVAYKFFKATPLSEIATLLLDKLVNLFKTIFKKKNTDNQ